MVGLINVVVISRIIKTMVMTFRVMKTIMGIVMIVFCTLHLVIITVFCFQILSTLMYVSSSTALERPGGVRKLNDYLIIIVHLAGFDCDFVHVFINL